MTAIKWVKYEETCDGNDGGSKGRYFLKMEALCPSENIVTTRTQCVVTHRNTVRVSNETDRDNLLAVFLEMQMVFVIVLYLTNDQFFNFFIILIFYICEGCSESNAPHFFLSFQNKDSNVKIERQQHCCLLRKCV